MKIKRINMRKSCINYFATRPPKGKEGNWIQAISGKNFFPFCGIYGPLKAFNDKTWKSLNIGNKAQTTIGSDQKPWSVPTCYRFHQGAVKLNRRVAALLAVLLFTPAGPAGSDEMRGLLVMGHEARSLQPCDDDRTLWVSARDALLQQLTAAVHQLTTRPYEEVYVELDGEPATEPAGEFAKDYDGTVEVRDVRLVSKQGIDACRRERAMVRPGAAPVVAPKTYVFVCSNSLTYTVRASGAEAWVFGREGTRRLTAMPAGQGNRYSDGILELWIDGEQAQLGESGGSPLSCRNDPRRAVWERAKLDGADFRAVGNEPGWNLEILAGTRMRLIADYGASRVEVPLPEPTMDREARRTRWDAGEIILEVIGRPCRDSMSGESFETEVSVRWRGRTLRGCGRALH